MPRDRKKPTLRERADATACKWGRSRGDKYAAGVYRGYLSGHRANRLTKAERALFDQCADLLFTLKRNTDTHANGWPASPEVKRLRKRLAEVVSNLERAKGRK